MQRFNNNTTSSIAFTLCSALAVTAAVAGFSAKPATASADSAATQALSAVTSAADVALTRGSEKPATRVPGAAAGDVTDSELAQRMRDALSGIGRRATPRTTKPKAQPHAAPKTWLCGEWKALWQGRGNGRDCEWR
jgi:endonuclease YncB( thermonuclease family)